MSTDQTGKPEDEASREFPVPDLMKDLPAITGGFRPGELIILSAQSRVGRSRINPSDVVISIVTKRDIDNAILSLRIAKKRPPSPDTVVVDSYGWMNDNEMPKPEEQTSERETK